MEVCDLSNGIKLYTDNRGKPFLVLPPAGMRPAGSTCELVLADRPDWAAIIEKWQADPANDVLRARGDKRWLAACEAASRCKD